MRNYEKTAKTMFLFGVLSLAGCASAPTLNFTIPFDKLSDFKSCMVGLEQYNNIELERDYFLKKNKHVISDQFISLWNMLDDFRNNIIDQSDKPHQSIVFDMHTPWLWFFDSKIENVVEDLTNPANISSILQPENINDISRKPSRIAKAQQEYLMAYFTVNQDKNGGFISSDGTIFKFPVEVIQGEGLSSVDHSQIGADIIRIILEAIRDGSLDKCNSLPAVSSATGVKKDLLRDFKDVKENNMECETNRIWKIPTDVDLSKMKARVNAAESMIATAAGKAMRGGSIGSLNNEALARAAETAIGVIARHTAERYEWCKASIE